jgi:hypothetical protein
MSSTSKDMSSGMSNQSAFTNGAVVIGLYGVPGTGKMFLPKSESFCQLSTGDSLTKLSLLGKTLLSQLKHELRKENFTFYDGSKIATLVPGGLDAFRKMEEQEKEHWRKLAIDTIGQVSQLFSTEKARFMSALRNSQNSFANY